MADDDDEDEKQEQGSGSEDDQDDQDDGEDGEQDADTSAAPGTPGKKMTARQQEKAAEKKLKAAQRSAKKVGSRTGRPDSLARNMLLTNWSSFHCLCFAI